MSLAFSIVDRKPQPVISIQTRSSMRDLPEVILQSLAKVGQTLEGHGLQPNGPAFVAYYNLDMHDMQVEIGFPVAEANLHGGEVQMRTIPGGPAGICEYVGPYQELAIVYQQLSAYIESQGREPTGISYEFYLNDPSETPPNELETHIVFPLVQSAASIVGRPPGNGRIHTLFW